MTSHAHPRSVAIVVPTLGERPGWLHDCLLSILSQDGVTSTVVVVAPTTADLDMCGGLDLIVVRVDEPGLALAISQGWAVSSGTDYVTWLGDDDLLAPGSLSTTVAFLDQHRDCSMVFGRARYIDEESNTLWISRPTRFAAPYLRLGKNFVTQQGSLLRRTAVDAVGGLDLGLRNAMDQDLFTRLGRVGRRAYIAQELGAYRWHKGSITWRKGSLDESEAVRRRYISPSVLGFYDAWRVAGRRIDWAWDALVRRLPVPPAPKVGGLPYTTTTASEPEDPS